MGLYNVYGLIVEYDEVVRPVTVCPAPGIEVPETLDPYGVEVFGCFFGTTELIREFSIDLLSSDPQTIPVILIPIVKPFAKYPLSLVSLGPSSLVEIPGLPRPIAPSFKFEHGIVFIKSFLIHDLGQFFSHPVPKSI